MQVNTCLMSTTRSVVDEVQDRDQQQPDGLAEIDQAPDRVVAPAPSRAQSGQVSWRYPMSQNIHS